MEAGWAQPFTHISPRNATCHIYINIYGKHSPEDLIQETGPCICLVLSDSTYCIWSINLWFLRLLLDHMTFTHSAFPKNNKQTYPCCSVQQLRGKKLEVGWKRNLIAPQGIFQRPEIMHPFDLLLVNTQGRRCALWPADSPRHLFRCKKGHRTHRQRHRRGARCALCGLAQLLGEWDVYMSPKWRMIE